jgi:ligand-binding SRPBCC domain-containing protein
LSPVVNFTLDIEIDRPPGAVFAFVSIPDNLHLWQNVVEVEQLTPGPVGQGTRFREVHQVMSRRNEQVTEFTAFEPGKRLDVGIVEGPAKIDGRWDFEPSNGGTRLTFTATGRLSFPLILFQPLLVAGMRRSFRGYHERLKQAVESQPLP